MTESELKKLVFYLDGLRYSFQMANLVFDRLKETLNEIAQCHSKDEYTEKQISSVLLDAWTLIDICHRVRELVQQMPRLTRKPPSFQVFLRETECIESLRHYVCHRALQNQPLVGTSESASLRCVIHIKFLDASKGLFN
jgi:hypothetical protein